MPENILNILLIEDNPGDARLIEEHLKECSALKFILDKATTLKEAEPFIRCGKVGLILLDLNLPDSSGLDTVKAVSELSGGQFPVIVLTGIGDELTGVEAIRMGANDFLIKSKIRAEDLGRTLIHSIERKKIELKLLESEERFRKLHESMIDAFVETDMQGYIQRCNNTYLEMIGYSFEELTMLTYKDLTPEIWHQYESDIVRNQILKRGYSEIYEKEYRKKDGSIIPVELRTSLLSDRTGTPTGMWAIVRDISDKKIFLQTIQKVAKEWRITFDSISDVIWLLDNEMRIIRANRASMSVFGINPEDLIGRKCFEVVHQTDTPVDDCPVIKAMTTLKPQTTVLNIKNSWYNISAFPLSGENELPGFVHVIRDITEQKKIENDLRDSEELFRGLFRNHAAVKLVIDPDTGHIIDANKAAVSFYGWTRDELLKMQIHQINTLTKEQIETAMENARKNKKTNYLFKHKRADGTIRDVEVYSSVINVKGKDYLHSIVHDITDRKLIEEKHLLISTAIENAPDTIIITDRDGALIYANPAFTKLTGYTIEEAIGKNPRELVKSGKHDRAFYKSMWEKISKGEVWTGEIINRRKNGTLYYEEMTIAPVKNDEGEILNFVAIKQDISDRKFAFNLIKSRLELFDFSINSTLHEVMVKALDEVEKFTESNISFFHLVDVDQNNITLQAWSTKTSGEFCKAEGRGLHYSIDKAGVWVDCVRTGGPVVHNDYAGLPDKKGLPDGHAPVIRELVVPVKREGIIKAILGVGNKISDYTEGDIYVTAYFADVIWDIIERLRREELLFELNSELENRVSERTAELEKSNRDLESFTYSISHDLRAPLRHIKGFADMLRRETEGGENAKVDHYVETIVGAAERMGRLIDALLSFSRIGKKELAKKRVDLSDLAEDVLQDFNEEITDRNIRVSKGPLPEVMCDFDLVRIVFTNLISNAVKFTSNQEAPRIEIDAAFEKENLVISVKDNGAGFDMRYSERLFGVFQRLHNERDFEGTGIGLAIVKSIIEKHGGKTWAEGKPDEGACFYFSIPCDKTKNDIIMNSETKRIH